jgi:branched-chain amino acid transport system permease protein
MIARPNGKEGKLQLLASLFSLQRLPIFIVLVILWLAPYLVGSYKVIFLYLIFKYLSLAASYDIIGGRMGYMNLGHSSFFGIGTYTFGILFSKGFGMVFSLTAAVILAVLFALGISYPLFRLREAYFALATFGLMTLLELLAFNLTSLTEGAAGLSIMPGVSGKRLLLISYYLALITALLTLITNYLIANSRFGLALASIREDEEVAETSGVPTFRYKQRALVISSIFPALMGGINMWQFTFTDPEGAFGIEVALTPVIMAMLGGTGTLWGPVIGVVFVTLVQELLWTRMPYLHLAVYGVALLWVGLLLPGGLVSIKGFNFLKKLFLPIGKNSRK